MSIPHKFLDVARDMLPKEQFDAIYAKAVAAERKAVLSAPSVPPEDRVEKPRLATIVNNHVTGEKVKPAPAVHHAAERLEERLDLEVGPTELGVLANMIKTKDRNVRIVKQRMDCVLECEVQFMGKHFICIYNASRNSLVTAYPKRKKKHKVLKAKTKPPRQKSWRDEMTDALEEMDI
jgi:hypothetical protein